jgi:hypothetical protein
MVVIVQYNKNRIVITSSGDYKNSLDFVYRYCIICGRFKPLKLFADDLMSNGKSYKKNKKSNIRLRKKKICINCL